MGKGDKKSRRGKIIMGSFGVRRRRKKNTVPEAPVKPVPVKKPAKKSPEPPVAEVKEVKTAVAAKPEAKPVKKKAAPKTAKKEKTVEDKPAEGAGE